MNYAEIKEYDIANGPGVRLTLFVSGCTHHCKACFNPETWNFDYGQPFTAEVMEELLDKIGESCYQGLTLLGGEPMEPVNQKGLLPLVKAIKARYPKKDIWCFTGYLFDRDILGKMAPQYEETMALLSQFDVMVDGEFKIEEKDVTLLYKGSRNQRTIDVQASLKSGEVVLWDPEGITVKD